MPYKSGEFQWNRGEAYADLTSGYYGPECDDEIEGLVNLENGVRKYWADQLRIVAESYAWPPPREALAVLVDLLDPYSGKDGAEGQFARTTAEGEEGAQWPSPDVK